MDVALLSHIHGFISTYCLIIVKSYKRTPLLIFVSRYFCYVIAQSA